MSAKGAKKKKPNTGLYGCLIKPYLSEIEELISKGYTEASIADQCGVSEQTFINYKRKYPELLSAILRGRRKVDSLVTSALLQRALGFYKEETKVTSKGVETVTRYYPPDIKAIQMIKRNYQTSDWKEMSDEERDFKERELKIKETLLKDKVFEVENE